MRFVITVLLLLVAAAAFGAYPDEYPIYLRMLGFSKDEIRSLQDGGYIIRGLKQGRPGESGITAARVFDVPGYFIRDYFSYIENFRSLQKFHAVGKFKTNPGLGDLSPLTFEPAELQELAMCRSTCNLNVTPEEVAGLGEDSDASTLYRRILLNRLSQYRKEGHTKTYFEDFSHVPTYFPRVLEYLKNYPESKDKRVLDFFYWVKEKVDKQNVIQIRHVFSQRIGEDFVVVNNLVYSNHALMASGSIVHLINYVDSGFPKTLMIYHGRNYLDPELGSASGHDKRLFSSFQKAGEELEKRYLSAQYVNFPHGLRPTDQR